MALGLAIGTIGAGGLQLPDAGGTTPPLWRDHPLLLAGIVGLILLQMGLIAGLLYQGRRRARAQGALDRQLAFETLLSEVSRRLLTGSAEEASGQLPALFGMVGEHFGVDRVGIVQWRDQTARPGKVVAWIRPGVPGGEPGRIELPWLHAAARRREILRWDSLEGLPAGAEGDLATLRALSTRSLLAVPLAVTPDRAAMLGMTTRTGERVWTDQDLEGLRALARAFGGHVLREWVEEEAAQSHALNAAVAEAVASEVAVVDADGTVWWMDDGAGERVTPEWLWERAANGTDILAALEEISATVPAAAGLGQVLRAALAGGGGTRHHECRHLRAGQERWCEAHVRPLDRSEGGIVLAFNDVSDRKRLELESQTRMHELAHVNRVASLGELTASLAHELNQPLTAILSNAQAARLLLDAGPANDDEVRGALDDIVQDDRRAGEIILRIRRLLRKGAIEPAPVDLNGLVGDVAQLAAATAGKRRVAVATRLAPDLPTVTGDPVQLQQVLLNLVINAVDATAQSDEPRLVTVSTRNGGPLVEVEVRDTGPGIPADHLPRIFNSFFSTKPDGLGMGLSISRRIVEAHGGRIWAESPGRGAVFRVALPLGTPGEAR